MTEQLDPDDVTAAIWAAEDDTAAVAIERRYVADTAEDDPGEVEHADHGGDG